jgi:hypothetical protein
MDCQSIEYKKEVKMDNRSGDEREVFQRIKDRLKTVHYTAENMSILSSDFGESLPVNFEEVGDDKIKRMVRYAKERIKNNIQALKEGSDDEWSSLGHFIKNIKYWERYGIGNMQETLDALLEFAKRNINNPEAYPPYATEYF